MKSIKLLPSMLGVAALAFTFSACSQTASSNAPAPNAANKANTAVVANANQTSANKTATPTNAATPVSKTSTTPTPADESEAEKIQGELQTGKTESVILYVGMESGDYAAYCFTNDSEAGRAILDACKDGGQCEVTGTTGEGTCKVPGLEATLSYSAKILKVASVKSRGSKK